MKYIVKKTRLNFMEDKPTVWQVQRLAMPTITEDALVSYIANSSHVPASTIRECLLAISEAITYFVINGHHVTFDAFGSFFLKMRAKVAYDKEGCSVKQIQRTTIGFKASAALSKIINETDLEKSSLSETIKTDKE